MFTGGRGRDGAGAGATNEQPHVPQSESHTTLSPHTPPSSSLATRFEMFASRIPQMYIAPFCGASAGVASGIVTCPLDVIKTKLQAQGGFSRRGGAMLETESLYRGMLGTGKVILREDGIRGLYQGLGPLLLGYLPTWAVYLAIYDRSRNYFYDKTGQCHQRFEMITSNVSQGAGGFPEAMLPSPPVHALQW